MPAKYLSNLPPIRPKHGKETTKNKRKNKKSAASFVLRVFFVPFVVDFAILGQPPSPTSSL
jgi:hypothetical protein